MLAQKKKRLSGLHINIMYCLLGIKSEDIKKTVINQGQIFFVLFSCLFLYIFYLHHPGNSMKHRTVRCVVVFTKQIRSIKLLLFIYIYLLKGNVLEVHFILIENLYMKIGCEKKKINIVIGMKFLVFFYIGILLNLTELFILISGACLNEECGVVQIFCGFYFF